jgi:hypothetical protein
MVGSLMREETWYAVIGGSSWSAMRMGSTEVLPRPVMGIKSDMRVIGFSALSPKLSRCLRRMERTTPVLAETGVLAFVLGWDIVKNAMGKMIERFLRYEVEVDFMERATSPQIWFQEQTQGVVNG